MKRKFQTEPSYIQKMVYADIVKDEDGFTRHVNPDNGKLGYISTGTFWPEDFANNEYGILNHQWTHFLRWGGKSEVNLDLFFKGNIPKIFQGKWKNDFFGGKIK